MNEKLPAPSPVAGGTQPKPGAVDAAGSKAAGPQSPAPVAQPAVAPAKSPSAFGGHVGGGKKREDGLVSGSAEAKKVDADNDALRQWIKRFKGTAAELETELKQRLEKIHPAHREKFLAKGAAAKTSLASLPPALSRPTDQTLQTSSAAPAVDAAQSLSVDGPASGAGLVPPTFVAWTHRMLERPIRTLTKIADRFRTGWLMTRIRKLGLAKDVEDEAERRMRYKDEQVADFNAALSNCAVIELNKRRVPGAEHSHWLELGMTGAELINCHLDTVDWLEKKILEKAEADKKATGNN